MRYELFLRRDEGLTAEAAAQASRRARAADLHAEPYQRQGQILGLDLGIGLDEPARNADALCSVAFDLAATFDLSVFDPQLGRVVAAAERAQVCERFASSVGSLTGFTSSPQRATRSSSARFWPVLVGVLLLAVLVARALACAAG